MGLLLDSLRSVDFLAGSEDDAAVRFMTLGRCADHPKGHVFWRAGKAPEGLVIPVSGEAKTTTRSPEGREFIDRILGPGECIGLPSALDGVEHPTDAEVVRAGEFFTIPRAILLKFLDDHPPIRASARAMIGTLYRSSVKDREDMALRPVPERVAEFLVRHACLRQGEDARVLIHATQAELAARLGTVREVVARIFSDFGSRGLIKRGGNGIFISDWKGLRAEAGLEDAHADDLAVRNCEETASLKRTARFFLPTAERMRRHDDPGETAKCLEYFGDLSLCRLRGCPGAMEAAKRLRTC